ncbi:hypothetical protein N7539_004520 [Penicillium diatomitis]|uniref:Uncharacterized protein n=1 Tax=Penicillium diatomitis TaxID=2819901 RepID=A0A9W9XDY9_9EURO|nr:uncharacterized protein N7539_004520 [Penicillium diatomitis]KAJ5489630.1 hypothetical protein N7539_004520 [Penicillium diatomitis]
MGSFTLNTFPGKLSLTQEPPINYQMHIKPMDWSTNTDITTCAPHEPNPLRRSRCEGDSLAYDAFWASRHPWDLVDYYLFLILIEKKLQHREIRLSRSWVIESDGSRCENFGRIIDSDDQMCQVGWVDPIVIFTSLPVPHAVGFENRRIALGMNLRSQSLVGYLLDSAPEDITEVVLSPAWEDREVLIDLPLQRFVDILGHSVEPGQKPGEILREGLLNYFRESSRRLHAGMDLVIVIQFIQFLRDAFFGGQMSAGIDYNATTECLSYLVEQEEHLRDILCRESNRAWMGAHTGVTVNDLHRRGQTPSEPLYDLFVDQVVASPIVNEFSFGAARMLPVQDTSAVLKSQIRVTTTSWFDSTDMISLNEDTVSECDSTRQLTSNIVVLLGLFCSECTWMMGSERWES